MVSFIAKRLVDWKCYKLSGWLLTGASMLAGKSCKISYDKRGFWRHRQNGWVINEAFPNLRMDVAALTKFMDDVYFTDYKPVNGDVCIDVGAGIGTETIYLGKLNATGGLYAIEASPFTFEILKSNVQENEIGNAHCFNLAISDHNGQIKIGVDTDDHISNSVLKSTEGVNVDAVTMDHFIKTNNIGTIKYLKVNIEGAEKLLIRGFSSINQVQYAAISCHDFLGKRLSDDSFYTKDVVLEFLHANGFTTMSQKTGTDYIDDWIYARNKIMVN